MMTVLIDCTPAIQKEIEALIASYSIKITETIDHQTIIIKEIISTDDIKNLKILKNTYHCHVICITDNLDFIFDIIDLLPISIWRKNHITHDSTILTDMIVNEKTTSTVMEFKVNSNTVLINTKDIIYLESFSHYLIVHTVNASFQIREKISAARQQFEKYRFIQIHKSYLVNKKYIKTIKAKSCLLTNNITLPIGKTFHKIHL